jgi:short-subunit dehydrogenase
MQTQTRRTAVITGASSGIGQATAQEFARKGWNLVLAARSRDDLETVAAECRAEGAQVLVVPTDVSDAAAVQKLADQARQFASEIDVWFSNVGVGVVGKFLEVPIETHEQTIRSNLIGHVIDAHAALPIFIAQGRGVFVNMISLGGFAAAPYAAAYSASKFGLRGFSEALRAELSEYPHVHFCDVYPAFVDTPALLHAGNHTRKQLGAPPPLLAPQRVARAVVRLADHPRRGVMLGSTTPLARFTHFLSPTLNARVMKFYFDRYFEQADPAQPTDGNVLSPPTTGARVEGGLRKPRTRLARAAVFAAAGAVVAGAGALLSKRLNAR